MTGTMPNGPSGTAGLRPWWALARLLDGQWRRLSAGIAVGVLQTATTLPVAWLIRQLFDQAGGRGPAPNIPLAVGVLLLLTFLTGLLGAMGQRLVNRAVKDAVAGYRRRLVSRIAALPKAVHDSHERTRFHDLLVHDTERMDLMLTSVAGQMVPNALVAVLLAGVLAFRSPGLFFVVMGALPFHFAVSRHSLRRYQQALASFRKTYGAFSRGFTTLLRSLELVWYNDGGPRERAASDQRIGAVAEAAVESAWRHSIHQRLQHFLYQAITAVVLVIGSQAVGRGTLTTGELVSFYVLAVLTLGYARDAGQGVGAVILGRESWLALHAFDCTRFEPPYSGTRRIAFGGRVDVDAVGFRYTTPGREHAVLEGVSLALRPGEIVVLTGANGSGKSTLLHLLLGMYRPTSGTLRADGIPYADLDLADLRRQIGVVPQDPQLVSGTIRENLAYARPAATQDELESAARSALADGFIRALPAGYDTIVGEHGVLLSGGQRQRLALARALVARPRLLVLDEPTNHVDQEGVRDLLASLRSIQPPAAILVVSHVPALAEFADVVLRIEGGRLSPAVSGA